MKQLLGREALTGTAGKLYRTSGSSGSHCENAGTAGREVIEQIPVFRLICRPEKEAVEILEQVLVKNIFRE